jgi:bidirectional [NiFe] hydrogenase diaphorase subunit
MDLAELERRGDAERAAWKPLRVRCCTAAGCQSAHSLQVFDALCTAVQERQAGEQVQVESVGCMRLCGQGPLVAVDPVGTLYAKVTPDDAPSVIAAVCGQGVSTAQSFDPNHPFFARQLPIVLENCGHIDPTRLESTLAHGGYQTLARVLHEMTPDEVVDAVTRSGLRGRGGAGYPTGLKWATVAKAAGDTKYVICNADEGDPGAFKDRTLLESDPHRVFEGMALAGYAVGASQGFIYIRGEYLLAIERLQLALKQARQAGLLGAKILDSAFDFVIDIRIGAGAFVCGEETALMSSIEGYRGTPRPRPPYPAESGLWGHPTLINNVESLATIPAILRRGAEDYAAVGIGKSRGTKVFSLSGQVKYTGLVEVPMGMPIRTIVEEMAGGAPEGHTIKAVQTGGPSGGCIPAELLDTPVDYEALAALGSIVGSGGMVVMDDETSMVEVAKFFMDFCRDESCGKCIPCRVGTVQMHRLLTRIGEGKARRVELTMLEDLADMVKHTSLCGLGQSAPNPVLSTLRHFRHEYEEKVADRPKG